MKTQTYTAIGLIYGTVVGLFIWLVGTAGDPTLVWVIGAGTGVGLVMGAAVQQHMTQKQED